MWVATLIQHLDPSAERPDEDGEVEDTEEDEEEEDEALPAKDAEGNFAVNFDDRAARASLEDFDLNYCIGMCMSIT